MQPEYFPWVLTSLGFALFMARFLYEIIRGSRGVPHRTRNRICDASEVKTAAHVHIDEWIEQEAASFLEMVAKAGRQYRCESISRVSPTGIRLDLTYGVVIDERHPACLIAVVLAIVCPLLVFLDLIRLVAASSTHTLSYMAMATALMAAFYYLLLVMYWGFLAEPGVLRRLLDVEATGSSADLTRHEKDCQTEVSSGTEPVPHEEEGSPKNGGPCKG